MVPFLPRLRLEILSGSGRSPHRKGIQVNMEHNREPRKEVQGELGSDSSNGWISEAASSTVSNTRLDFCYLRCDISVMERVRVVELDLNLESGYVPSWKF